MTNAGATRALGLHGWRVGVRCSASSSASWGPPEDPEQEQEPDEWEKALSPDALQRFFELNAGQWQGTLVQFDFHGCPVQAVPVALSASALGTGNTCRLHQTLRIKPGPQRKGAAEDVGAMTKWVEVNLPEMNRFSVDSRHQVGYFEEEGAYAVSHLTAEVLGEVLRVGILGEGAEDSVEVPGDLKLPTERPALVSEVCLSSRATKASRARAFHVLDPRGLIDTVAVFLEGQEGAPSPQLKPQFSIGDILGKWQGTAKVSRSDLYGATTEERPIETSYSISDDTLSVESTSGSRVIHSKGVLSSNVLLFNGGLQTIFLPGGMSFTFPQVVPRGNSFFFEFGWLAPDGMFRQRIIRTYDADGMVVSTTLSQEEKLT